MCETYRQARDSGCGCTGGARGVILAAGCLLGAAALQETAQRVASSGVVHGMIEAASSALELARILGIATAALVLAALLSLGAAAIRREARRMLAEDRPRVEVLEAQSQPHRRPRAALPVASEIVLEDLVLDQRKDPCPSNPMGSR